MCGYIGGFCRHGRQLRERPSVLLQANASAIVEGHVLQSMPIFGQHGCVEIWKIFWYYLYLWALFSVQKNYKAKIELATYSDSAIVMVKSLTALNYYLPNNPAVSKQKNFIHVRRI